jgi:hypothetical protein
MASLVRMSIALVIASAVVWAAGADEPPTGLDKARSAYDKAREKHRGELLKRFDEVVERITTQKSGAEERAKRIDVVNAEKERFEKDGLIPWSESMRPHLVTYQKNLGLAEAPLRKAFDREIDLALKAKDGEQVNKLRTDLAIALDVKVVATWTHDAAGLKSETKLYSNGKLHSPNHKATWTFQNGVLALKWPNAAIPGGVWTDTCTVSADGLTYSCKNQMGALLRGKYVEKP